MHKTLLSAAIAFAFAATVCAQDNHTIIVHKHTTVHHHRIVHHTIVHHTVIHRPIRHRRHNKVVVVKHGHTTVIHH